MGSRRVKCLHCQNPSISVNVLNNRPFLTRRILKDWMTTYSCHKCKQLILSDTYQLENKGTYFSFCQSCAEKGIEFRAGKVYHLCFDSNCPKENGKERIFLTKKRANRTPNS